MDRLKSALHYVIDYARIKNLNLGGVKLLKIIVFSDVASFYHRGRVITGAKIVKAPNGPVPHGHQEALDALEAEGKIQITKGDRQHFEPTRLKSLASPDISGFEVDELVIMNALAEEFCGRYSAIALSNLTHNHSWGIADMGEEIPLASYLGRRIESTPGELAQIAAELKAARLDGEISIEA
jgi:hypothetical protein